MAKSEPRYDAGYPLAIESVYAQRLGDSARQYGKWVRDACLKTYRAIGKSGAVVNTDAADGRDVSADDLLVEMVTAATVKKVRDYIKYVAGKNYRLMTRVEQERLINAVAQLISQDATEFLAVLPALLKDGEFGAIPAFTISEVGRQLGIALAKDVARVTGSRADPYLRIINHRADTIQGAIINGKFGLTDKYFATYYQRFHLDGVPLVDLKKALPATPDMAGAITEQAAALARPVTGSSVVPSLPAMDKTRQQLTEVAIDDFKVIIRAAEGVDLAPGVKLPTEKMVDLISVDVFEGNKPLQESMEDAIARSMGRMQNVSEEALQRGVKIMQQGLREGRGAAWVEEQLVREMEIPQRRAANVARNEVGNGRAARTAHSARMMGVRIYRWRGRLDERERKEHVKREGKAYYFDKPPRDGNPGEPHFCRCEAELMFAESDAKKAEKEIAARNPSQQ
ncbi:phage minor head protein [Citrobacter portucalensis]|uniref:phage minor head protein n=1 Tax=Citrobacter portucalensis TaxID=1639133 RepID=UPI0022442942|nr:phage minor head protein [Citrobacter portucalensis]MCW8351664.1 minor capsid protein [Citrobacter portucalensis]MCX9043491.1 phage minor head protein [Citrobacter portucalensis]